MVFSEMEAKLNINNSGIINPGIPCLENAEETRINAMCYKFEIARYSDSEGIRRRYVEGTIDLTNYVDDVMHEERNTWNVKAMQELLNRLSHRGYKGIVMDQEVIEKFRDYDSVDDFDCYIDDDGLAHFCDEELD